MKTVRLLIVEDNPKLSEELKSLYHKLFTANGFANILIDQVFTVAEARKLAKANACSPYDLVSLDVILDDAHMTGLDTLETFKRYKSAWMVALLTGVEGDASADKTTGKEKADRIRQQLRRDAYSHFPAERLLVVEKPSALLAEGEAQHQLFNRLNQIVLVYQEVGRQRYVFRPVKRASLIRKKTSSKLKKDRGFIETVSLHWTIRYDCGEISTLPDYAGMQTLCEILSLNRDEFLTPEEALIAEPRTRESKKSEPGEDAIAAYFVSRGIANWGKYGKSEQDCMIKAALAPSLIKFKELRQYQDEGDLTPNEESDLERIIKELGPLHDTAEAIYHRLKATSSGSDDVDQETEDCDPGYRSEMATLEDEIGTRQDSEETPSQAARLQAGLHEGRGNYNQRPGGIGMESPEANLFCARKKRVCEYLRENGFIEFAKHVEDYVSSTGANWSYHPPHNTEWTTS